MAEFNADKLRERLERLNREQLERLERLTEELLRETQREHALPKRPERSGVSPEAP